MKNNFNLIMLFVLAYSWIMVGLSTAMGIEVFIYIFGATGFIAFVGIALNLFVFKNEF